jgi:hypothetical protein
MGFYKKIVLQRSDGSLIVRDISSIASAGGGSIFVLLLSSPLPDTSFVSAQPIFVCSFDQDDLEEAWATSGVVPAFRLGIVEEPDYGTAPIPSLGYAQQSPGFLGISGCNLLLRAGVGCLTASGAPSTVWSGTDAYVSKIVDESQSVVRMPTKLQVFKALDVASGNNTANLVRWSAPWQNNGQPSIRDASYTLSHQTFTGRPVGDRHLWSVTNGWTLFLCWTPQNRSVVASDTTLFRIVSPELELHFKHDTAGASGAGRSRLVVNTVTAHLLTQEMTNANYPTIVTLHISSAGSLRIWVNGTQACAPSLTLSLPNVSGYSVSEWFTFLNTNRPTTSPILANEWGVSGAMNLMLSYDRGLDISEINQVHELIADIYKTAVTPSSLF